MQHAADVELDALNDAGTVAVRLVPPGSRVLDLGCGTGEVAARLRERGCRVWGVELDETAARRARAHCETVVVGDVEALDLGECLGEVRFDAILVLDVLERLRDPAAVLRGAGSVLAPGGRLIASIANVGHGALRLNLLRGRFEYQDAGLLDRRHLHLYDAAATDELFVDADMIVAERLRVTRGLTEAGIDIDPADFSAAVIDEVMADPEALTFQFIRVAVPRDSRVAAAFAAAAVPDSLVHHLRSRVEELERVVREGAAAIQRVSSDLAAQEEQAARARSRAIALEAELAELEEALRERMGELEQAENSRRHVEMDLHVKEAYIEELRLEAGRAGEREAALRLQAEQDRARADGLAAELAGLVAELERLRTELARFQRLRYRAVDRVNQWLWRIPLLHRTVRTIARAALAARRRLRRVTPVDSAEEVAG